jgi:hypothetical protein
MAFQLRAMNIIYETTKERGATILIPTAMVDAMNPTTALALALANKTLPDAAPPAPPPPARRAPKT